MINDFSFKLNLGMGICIFISVLFLSMSYIEWALRCATKNNFQLLVYVAFLQYKNVKQRWFSDEIIVLY